MLRKSLLIQFAIALGSVVVENNEVNSSGNNFGFEVTLSGRSLILKHKGPSAEP